MSRVGRKKAEIRRKGKVRNHPSFYRALPERAHEKAENFSRD
jgi:hypothetical protein